ncbi:MAG: phosphoribosylformylglycinamidine synthase subunit PurS, partial [Gaiellaceae bacterium]
MKATILVRPKPGILDPQGEAVQSSLRQLGFHVDEARVGRVIDLELDDGDETAA